MTKNPNPSIKCSVTNCAHHSQQNACTLSEITVGCCSASATDCKSTECDSFQAGGQAPCCGC